MPGQHGQCRTRGGPAACRGRGDYRGHQFLCLVIQRYRRSGGLRQYYGPELGENYSHGHRGRLAIAYWRFLGALSDRSRRLFVLTAIIYVGGALGTEFFVNYWVFRHDTDTLYGSNNIVQETMELSGLAVFFVALLGYMRESFSELRIVVE
jgi:hypothetical protein